MTLAGDEAKLAAIADELVDGLTRAIPGWIEREVTARAGAAGLDPADEDRAERIRAVGAATLDLVRTDLRRVITADVDSGAGNPLAVLRAGLAPATDLLSDLGVPPADRDDFARRAFPADAYDLGPAAFADVDESLHEPGLVWGAARAHVHLRRRAADAGSHTEADDGRR